MRKRQSSLLTRLLMAFLILLLPLQALGGAIIYLNNKTLRESVFDSASADVRFLMRTLETRLTDIRDQLMLMVNERDKSIRAFYVEHAQYGVAEYYTKIRSLMDSLSLLRANNSLLRDVELFYPAIGIRISPIWGVRPLTGPQAQAYIHAYETSKRSLIVRDGDYLVGQLYPITAHSQDQQPLILFQATLSKNELSALLLSSGYDAYPTALIGESIGCLAVNAQADLFTGLPDGAPTIRIDGRLFHVLSADSEVLGCSVVKYLPEDEVFGRSKPYIFLLIGYLLLSIPALLAYALMIRHLVDRPVGTMLNAFRRMRSGDLSFTIEAISSIGEFARLIEGLNEMLQKLNHSIQTVYRQEIYAKQIELKQLQSQINPHFLYNTFFMLKHLIKDEDLGSAGMLSEYLGEYFHYITRSAYVEVPLADEYRHALNYLQIQHMRFQNRLQLEVMALPEPMRHLLVPKIILQPILENALTHAVGKEKRASRIQFRFAEEPPWFLAIIEDDGETLEDGQLADLCEALEADQSLRETTGLINIHRRLALRFGAPCGLTLSRSPLGGLRVTMRLPIQDETRNGYAALQDSDRG